jgi:hypothetical protein
MVSGLNPTPPNLKPEGSLGLEYRQQHILVQPEDEIAPFFSA